MESDKTSKNVQDREALRSIIAQWNANRLDLFELSEPNEDLEFHGVMRFYFQDAGQKVATKCIRVSSTATAQVVIETLIEKFRPDMRMLSIPEYALYEIHENGEDRKLEEIEKPLLVQLNWHKDDRDGRFLLRRMDEKTFVNFTMNHQSLDDGTHFKRKLSKREKKEKKKREKLLKPKVLSNASQVAINEDNAEKDGIAEKLYSEMPETSFTRSISNPEAVMRRRRQQKLEKKLQQFRSTDGGPDTGGTLKIYGESLCRDVPYKTLLLSVKDNAAYVVKEMLEKYGLEKEEASNYCLVQVVVIGERDNLESNIGGPQKELILDDDDCPLAILLNQHPGKGSIMFHIRRRPVDYQPRKRKKKPKSAKGDLENSYPYGDVSEKLPFLLELNTDGSEILSGTPKKYTLHLNVTEVGSERGMSPNGQCLQLFGPNVQSRHCVIAHTEGIVTVTPCSRDAETHVNNQRIYETTILQHGMVVRFGRIHCFRFYNSGIDEKRLGPDGIRHPHEISYDRHSMKDDSSLHHSYDVDGNADTVSNSNLKDYRRLDTVNKNNINRRGPDPILPAVLELWEDNEDAFLSSIILNLDTTSVQFKLAPTYALYMAARFQASTHFHPEITPNERAHRLTASLSKVASRIQTVIQERYLDAGSLAFWMANSSELLHFLKQDRHLSPFCVDAQDILAECVQVAFRNLAHCLQDDLLNAMPKFLEDRDDLNEEEGATREVLSVLVSTMALLRRCRVNAALTIQLFSQLFHFINMWLFNKIVCEPRAIYATQLWGVRLKCRLSRVEMWAEKQGLELAADCHLSRILQAAHLLQAPKSSPDDLAAISSMCFKLNSLQLRALLERYQPAHDEPHIPHVLIENVVKVAENTADEMARSDGRDVRLEENPDLQLPFLLPEDGYSCDIVRGVPAGLQEFITPYQLAGLCRMAIQPSSIGYWTIYMTDHDTSRAAVTPRSPSVMSYQGDKEQHVPPGSSAGPEVVTIKLQKSNNGMGLSIVAARGVGQDKLGIYIKSVVKGGAADLDGRLQAGDQLLKVDGQSLVGISQEKAAEYMTRTGSVVILEVGKQGAMFHGLATLLSQPSPVIHRSGPGYSAMRRLSERDIHGKVLKEQTMNNSVDMPPTIMPRMQSSKSVPALNSGNAAPQEPIWNANGQANHANMNGAYDRQQHNSNELVASGVKNRPTNNVRSDNFGNAATLNSVNSSKMFNGDSNQKNRPLSHPNVPQDEERHYQNIGVYLHGNQQSQQHPPSHSGQPTQDSQTPPIKSGFGVAEDRMSQRLRASQGALNRPEMQQQLNSLPQRPVSALLSQWEREHLNASMSHQGLSGSHRSQDDSNLRNNLYPMHQANKFSPRPVANQNIHSKESQDQSRPPNHPVGGVTNQDATQNTDRMRNDFDNWRNDRDAIRQEAKMEEMREEVKRREDRLARERKIQELQQQQQQQKLASSIPQQLLPNQNLPMQHLPDRSRVPPPTQPKPRFPISNNQFNGPPPNSRYFVQDVPPERPPLPSEELIQYRLESPQPPPPPPSTTHPLYQQQQQNAMQRHRPGEIPTSRSVEHFDRHLQNVNYDIHSGKVDHMNTSRSFPSDLVQSTVSPSPWDREERERERVRRLDEARRLRDQEIEELESLGPQRTLKEEERLRTLRLEQEFQRRAEELKNEDDEENEDEDDSVDRRGLLRLVQEDLERNRLKRMERENERAQYQQKLQQAPQQQHLTNLDPQRQERRLQFVEPEKNWRKEPVPQPSQIVHSHPPLNQGQQYNQAGLQNSQMTNSSQPPPPPGNLVNSVRSEEWLRRQQEVKEQRQRLQHVEQQSSSRFITQNRPARLEEVNQIREQKREQERAALKELQVAREAEERLLREAQLRQEADLRRERTVHQQQQMQYNQPKTYSHYEPYSPPASYNSQDSNNNRTAGNHWQAYSKPETMVPQKYDNYVKYQQQPNQSDFPSNYSINDVERKGYNPQQQITNGGSVVEPPERKDSFEKTAMHYPDGSYWEGDSNVSAKENAPPPKRVSFHDSKEVNNASQEGTPIQQNLSTQYGTSSATLLSTPSNTQQITTFTTGSTPGVIGAQEVYRDPRQRIEASRNPVSNVHRGPGPEQLSFREKMKKFALETGEDITPKDKLRLARN